MQKYSLHFLFAAMLALGAFGLPAVESVVDDVALLAQKGLGEEVLLAYVDRAGSFTVAADQIVRLKEAGVPEKVIAAMIRKQQAPAEQPVLLTRSATDVPVQARTEYVYRSVPAEPAETRTVYVYRPATSYTSTYYVPSSTYYYPSTYYASSWYYPYSSYYYPSRWSYPTFSLGLYWGGSRSCGWGGWGGHGGIHHRR